MTNDRIYLSIIAISIVGLLIVIQQIILSVVINSKVYNINESLFNNFGINWGQGQIDSISISQNSCGISSKNALVSITFPGFKSGCFCQNSGYFIDICTEAQITQGCKSFPETKPKLLYSWDGNICTQRPLNQNYFTMNKTIFNQSNNAKINGNECDKNYKNCGILDTLNSTLCVEVEKECPINGIQVIKNDGQNKKLSYNNTNVDGIIVNQFLITDHEPCADPSENKIQLNEKSEYCENLIGEYRYDKSWVKIDSITLEALVNNNDLSQQMNQYPFWNKIKNRNVYLYYKNYIGITDKCIHYGKVFLKPKSLSDLPSMILNSKNEIGKSNIDFTSIVSITIYILLLLGYSIKILIAFKGFKMSYNIYSNSVLIPSSIILFIVTSISTFNILSFRNNYYWLIGSPPCLDELNNLLLIEMDKPLRDSYNIGVICIILSMLLCFLPLIEFIVNSCIEDCDYNDEIQIENEKLDSNKKSEIQEGEQDGLVDNEEQTVEMTDLSNAKKIKNLDIDNIEKKNK